jgi:hypothetical protein
MDEVTMGRKTRAKETQLWNRLLGAKHSWKTKIQLIPEILHIYILQSGQTKCHVCVHDEDSVKLIVPPLIVFSLRTHLVSLGPCWDTSEEMMNQYESLPGAQWRDRLSPQLSYETRVRCIVLIHIIKRGRNTGIEPLDKIQQKEVLWTQAYLIIIWPWRINTQSSYLKVFSNQRAF